MSSEARCGSPEAQRGQRRDTEDSEASSENIKELAKTSLKTAKHAHDPFFFVY